MAAKFTDLLKKIKLHSPLTHYSPPSETTSQKQPVYNAYTLPLQLWIDVNVSGDTSLIPNWTEIFEQYCDLTGDKTASEVFILEKKIAVLRQKIYITKLIVAQLANNYDEELVNILRNDLFFFWSGDINLENILVLLKTDEVALEVTEAELSKISSDSNKNKTTEFDYTTNLSELSKFQGYLLNPKVVTLAEYIAISNRYAKHIEYLKRSTAA